MLSRWTIRSRRACRRLHNEELQQQQQHSAHTTPNQQRPNPARNWTRRHHGHPAGAARVARSTWCLRRASWFTQRKQTPTSGCSPRRSKLAVTVRSPQHQHPGGPGGSTESASTAVRAMPISLPRNQPRGRVSGLGPVAVDGPGLRDDHVALVGQGACDCHVGQPAREQKTHSFGSEVVGGRRSAPSVPSKDRFDVVACDGADTRPGARISPVAPGRSLSCLTPNANAHRCANPRCVEVLGFGHGVFVLRRGSGS